MRCSFRARATPPRGGRHACVSRSVEDEARRRDQAAAGGARASNGLAEAGRGASCRACAARPARSPTIAASAATVASAAWTGNAPAPRSRGAVASHWRLPADPNGRTATATRSGTTAMKAARTELSAGRPATAGSSGARAPAHSSASANRKSAAIPATRPPVLYVARSVPVSGIRSAFSSLAAVKSGRTLADGRARGQPAAQLAPSRTSTSRGMASSRITS